MQRLALNYSITRTAKYSKRLQSLPVNITSTGNGKGYPKGIKGEEIHLYARIAAIADVFDALGSKRCYKDAWPIEKIIVYMKDISGQQFDPAIINWVIDNIESMKLVRELYPDTDQ